MRDEEVRERVEMLHEARAACCLDTRDYGGYLARAPLSELMSDACALRYLKDVCGTRDKKQKEQHACIKAVKNP